MRQAWQVAVVEIAMPRSMSAQGTVRYFEPRHPLAFKCGNASDFKIYRPQRLLADQVTHEHARLMEMAKGQAERWKKAVASLESIREASVRKPNQSSKQTVKPKSSKLASWPSRPKNLQQQPGMWPRSMTRS